MTVQDLKEPGFYFCSRNEGWSATTVIEFDGKRIWFIGYDRYHLVSEYSKTFSHHSIFEGPIKLPILREPRPT